MSGYYTPDKVIRASAPMSAAAVKRWEAMSGDERERFRRWLAQELRLALKQPAIQIAQDLA